MGGPGFDAFVMALAERLALDGDGWSPDDTLVDRLGWDSLAVIEVLSWLDEQAVHLPDDLIGELRTLGDLHHYATSPGCAVPEPRVDPGRSLLEGRFAVLTPVTPADHEALFALFVQGHHLTRFRLRGITPSPEAFRHQLWDRVLAQFVVRSAADGRIAGLASAYEPDFRNRHAHVAALAAPWARSTSLVPEGVALLVSYLFATFDLRKVYAEALAGNLAQFASGVGRLFEVEGRLRDHEYADGRYEDLLIVSVRREAWRATHERLLGGPAPY